MKKCPFCEKETKPSAHIYSCAKKTNFEGTKNDIKYEFIKYNNKGLCIKEIFIRKYTDELYSIPDFTKEYDTDNKTILFLIEYYGLKKRTISESAKLISVHKYKKTCQEKYGCDNASKSETIKEKKKETFISNYGVDNIFKSDKFKIYLKQYKIDNGYSIADNDVDDWSIYSRKCIRESRKNYDLIKKDWDGYDYYDGKYIIENYNLNPNHSNYPTIDHKTSILNGYKNNIPIYIISSISNLCITKRYINSSKHSLNEDEFLLKLFLS